MPTQSLLSKYFCIIASQNCLTGLCSKKADTHLRKKWPHFIVFRLLALKAQIIYYTVYENYYIQCYYILHYYRFSAGLSGSDNFVLLDGNGAYSQMFYAIFQFCAQVKFATYLQPVQDHCSWSEQSLFPVEKRWALLGKVYTVRTLSAKSPWGRKKRTDLIEHHPVWIDLRISFWIQNHRLIGSEVGESHLSVLRTNINDVTKCVIVKVILTNIANPITCKPKVKKMKRMTDLTSQKDQKMTEDPFTSWKEQIRSKLISMLVRSWSSWSNKSSWLN